MRISEEKARALGLDPGPARGKNKYHNQAVTVRDETFDSKMEEAVCRRLRGAYGPESVMRQVSIPLGGGNRMVLDFLIVLERFDDGTFRAELVDAKGMITPKWRTQARQLWDKFRLKIRTITK